MFGHTYPTHISLQIQLTRTKTIIENRIAKASYVANTNTKGNKIVQQNTFLFIVVVVFYIFV